MFAAIAALNVVVALQAVPSLRTGEGVACSGAAFVLIAYWVWGLRRGSFPRWVVPFEFVAAATLAVAAEGEVALLGMVYTALYFRSIYGRTLDALLVILAYAGGAWLAAVINHGTVTAAVAESDLTAQVPGMVVTVVVMQLLARALAEKETLLALTQRQASTDALTGLPNRRALVRDVEAAVAQRERPHVLVLFDLDGFKAYNDNFGHPAGDALLVRLGAALSESVSGVGTAYRMGGDEFCVLLPADESEAKAVIDAAAAALTERGDLFHIGASYGCVAVPVEAAGAARALQLADERMYRNKGAGRRSAAEQAKDVLLSALTERSDELAQHGADVADLAYRTAQALGLREQSCLHVRQAAELHDVGKVAIPDTILTKPGALDESEWQFIRTHTEIGERILAAAPDLRRVAQIVRSSHEAYDGSGYPDGLAGEEIPIEARIVLVCDAFDAMTTQRPYNAARSPEGAIRELKDCAGTQFDPDVVAAFIRILEHRDERPLDSSRGAQTSIGLGRTRLVA